MIELPRVLAPWRDELAIFPREVALSVVPWIPRLALAVGPLRAHTNAKTGAPDGFGGLARRGSYERLLLSEWLLALEMPDEFTRRAAMGEHAFLELARREPAGSTRSTALFDAGPSQLGTPRIAHIALLIVLARRAKEAGADFNWGILQEPDGWCYDELTESSILGLLEARCPHEPTSADIEDWFDRVKHSAEDDARAADDVWLIGSRRLHTLAPAIASSKVEVSDLLDREARKVKVAVRRTRAIEAEIELDLPDERECVRVLRDPFRVTKPAPTHAPRSTNATSNLLFSPDGRKLFARAIDGSVIVYRPPNSPRAAIAQPRILTSMGEQVVAIGTHGKDSYSVSSDTKQLSVRGFSRRGRFRDLWKGVEVPSDFPSWHPGGRSPLEPCFVAPTATTPQEGLIFLDAVGRLLHLRITPPKKLELLEWGVVAIARVNRQLVFAVDHLSGWPLDFSQKPRAEKGLRYLARLGPKMSMPEPVEPFFELDSDDELAAHFGWPGALAHATLGVFASKRSDTEWNLIDRTGRFDVPVDEGARVFGATMRSGHQFANGILAIESDGRTVTWTGRSGKVDLLIAEQHITFATASHARSDFAYVLANGDIAVHSLEHGPLMRVQPTVVADVEAPK